MKTSAAPSPLEVEHRGEAVLLVRLQGDWTLGARLPSRYDLMQEIGAGKGIRKISFDATGLGNWDSTLLTFLLGLTEAFPEDVIDMDGLMDSLPSGVRDLLKLAAAVPERKGARRSNEKEPILSRTGGMGFEIWRSILEFLEFLGESAVASYRLVSGAAQFRTEDFTLTLEQCGPRALGIVSLISILVGLIFAFVGAIQLQLFGAEIFVADLVGISVTRVMGAIMVGIIMAGRTGAAFAAQLGTMQVNEEIDALKTLGISPMEYLVLPRMLALAIMMPMLCLYADLMGILGGLFVGVTMLDLNPWEYFNETKKAVSMTHIWIGVIHSSVFGVIIALSGCLQGMKCGRSASAVGLATTSSVVQSIVAIVVATGVITVICNVLGI